MMMKKIWMLAVLCAGVCATSQGKPAVAIQPDFVVSSLTLDPAVPVRGGTFTATVTVLNQGEVSGDAGTVRVWASKSGNGNGGGEGEAEQAAGTLAAGESKVLVFTLAVPTRPGTHHARAFVDAEDVTDELNEGNNQLTANYKPQDGGQVLPAVVGLQHLAQVYDGAGKAVAVDTDPAGLAVAITYNGAAEIPVGAGSYAVVATVVEPNYEGSATGTLVVAKAPAMITLENLVQVYDGLPKPVEVSTDPDGLPADVVYGAGEMVAARALSRGASQPPVAAGRYPVEAVAGDENHEGASGATLEILQAEQAIDFPEIGDRLTTETVELAATASSGLPVEFSVASGPGVIVDGTILTLSDTGEVAIVASQAGDENWEPAAPAVRIVTAKKGPAALVLSSANVRVREGGEGRFFVRLSSAPTTTVVVAVARSAGTADLTVTGGATLTFKPSNWNGWQVVTLAAGEDENASDEAATLQLSGPEVSGQSLEATVLDDDFADNLALASAGATITGSRAYVLAQAIDGVHNARTNYAYAMWANAVRGSMTIDLRATSTVSRVRLLNWDWTPRFHRYTIESSLNGTDWTLLADASGEDRQGWDDWEVANQNMRYLRFTGLSNSVANGICISEFEVYGARAALPKPEFFSTNVNVREAGEGRVYVRLDKAPEANVSLGVARSEGAEGLSVRGSGTLTFTPANWSTWQLVTLVADADVDSDPETAIFRVGGAGVDSGYVQATALDDDIGENLALASGGATISGRRGYLAEQLIDGIHTARTNYGWMSWMDNSRGSMTLDLQSVATVSRVRLLNWDWTLRTHRYTVESSVNGTDWVLLADASGTDRQGWDDWAVEGESIRYLRFTALSNSVANGLCISELEVYGERQPAGRGLASARSLGGVPESEPVLVMTSDDVAPVYESGWAAVDGDPETAWVGQQVGGGYLVVEYQPALELSALEVDLAAGSLADIEYLYSVDGQEWLPLPEDMEENPVTANYLWLVFPDDGTAAVPQVIEIWPNP